jgi:preprotein translocase SecE subunit
MMAIIKNVRSLVALSLMVLVTFLSVSAFSVGVAANDTATAADDETVVALGDVAAADETTAAADTTAAVTTAADDTASNDAGLGLGFWISMGVLAVLIGIGVFFGIKYRDGLAKWLRSYKSELKRIVWMPWPEVRKNTIVVIVVITILGILIAMLDFVFSKGIIALGNIISV